MMPSGVMLEEAMRKVLGLWPVSLMALAMSGCSELGMCSKESLFAIDSPDGRYRVEVVSADCVGTSRARWVVMKKLSGALHDSKSVAIFDDSNPDVDLKISVKWVGSDRMIIHTHGAKVWSFQPNWHDVKIMEK